MDGPHQFLIAPGLAGASGRERSQPSMLRINSPLIRLEPTFENGLPSEKRSHLQALAWSCCGLMAPCLRSNVLTQQEGGSAGAFAVAPQAPTYLQGWD